MPFFSRTASGSDSSSTNAQACPRVGGHVQTILEARVESLPSWGSRGSILFSDLSVKGRGRHLRRAGDGGEPKQVTRLDRVAGEREHFWPSFLPDGEHFFFLASRTNAEPAGLDHTVYVGSVPAVPPIRVTDIDSRDGSYVPTGHVLYANEGTVLAQKFDTRTFQLRGRPDPDRR